MIAPNEVRGAVDAVEDGDPAEEGRDHPKEDKREERTAASANPTSPEPR